MSEMRKIPGFPGYFVTRDGEVFSKRTGNLKRRAAQINPQGYARVGLQVNGRPKHIFVHRLVLLAFHGEPIEGQVCRHLNGKCDDNRASNLRWGSYTENASDMVKHGTIATGLRHGTHTQPHSRSRGLRHGSHTKPHSRCCGSRHGRAKLTEEDVVRMRALSRNGIAFTELGIMFGVAEPTARQACNGLRWRHLP